MSGSLHLLPVPINEEANDMETQASLPPSTLQAFYALRHFIVETPKTARRWLKCVGHPSPIHELLIHPLPETPAELKSLIDRLHEGVSMGLLSDAGCPGIADPGAALVRLAHEASITVVPHIGPSSLLLTLMASGLEGQRFSFRGYLPQHESERIEAIRSLEALSKKEKSTQLFIETPYRNEVLLASLLNTLNPKTDLTVALHLTGPDASIVTASVDDWKKKGASLPKRPTLFALLA